MRQLPQCADTTIASINLLEVTDASIKEILFFTRERNSWLQFTFEFDK